MSNICLGNIFFGCSFYDPTKHFNGLQHDWDNMKRVKHQLCNQFILNMHTLAGSLSGIIYNDCTEGEDTTILQHIESILLVCFKAKHVTHHMLNNTLIGFDRGYNCHFKNEVGNYYTIIMQSY